MSTVSAMTTLPPLDRDLACDGTVDRDGLLVLRVAETLRWLRVYAATVPSEAARDRIDAAIARLERLALDIHREGELGPLDARAMDAHAVTFGAICADAFGSPARRARR